jgi:flagellar basal-body rod protein FlgF
VEEPLVFAQDGLAERFGIGAGAPRAGGAGGGLGAEEKIFEDEGGGAVFIPPDAAQISLAQDGTLSADGEPLTRMGLWQPVDPLQLAHEGGTLFASPAGLEPAEGGVLLQGFIEESNVNPIAEVSRMIEVQRAYEMGQGLLDREDDRVRSVIRTLGQ